MDSARPAALTLAISVGICGAFLFLLAARYHNPYPPMPLSLANSQADLKDVGGIALGSRRLAADIAWVQTLQYYGTPEQGQSVDDFHNGLGKYPLFLDHCRHVVSIDPYFTYVYYYGGAVLGWNLNRLSEAEALLREGITHNPNEWRLPQYLAGLAYQKNHNVKALIQFLESVIHDPQCPLMMKALLANLYKKQGDFDKSIALWEAIYATGDPNYKTRAIYQVQEIAKLKRRPA